MCRQGKRWSGYAARSTLKHARERQVRNAAKQSIPRTRAPQRMFARLEKNLSTASKNESRPAKGGTRLIGSEGTPPQRGGGPPHYDAAGAPRTTPSWLRGLAFSSTC